MLKITTFLFLLFSIQILNAQATNEKTKISRFSTSYSVGYQHLRMGDINRYYLDTFAIPNNLFSQNIRHSMYRNMELSYRFNNGIGFGFSLKTNEQSIQHDSPIYFMDELGNITDTIFSNNQLTVRNNSFGIFARMDCGKLIDHYSKSPVMKDWQLHLMAGATLNTMYVNLSTNSSVYNHEYRYFQPSIGWNTQVKISYPIIRGKSSQLRLGFTLGYQYAKTKQLRTDAADWIVLGQYPITADFSGFNAGLGLSYQINHERKKVPSAPSKSALYLDIFGQSTYGSLVYERILNVESTRIQHAVSLGFMRLNRIPWDYLGVVSIPIAYNAYFDFNRTKNSPSKLELGFGITALGISQFDIIPTRKEQYLYPSLRIGYCYHSYRSGLLFKATFTPLLPGFVRNEYSGIHYTNFGSASFFDRPVMPWIGLSIGKTF
ncbi:MAG: hypothetical protein RLZZ585_1904 [Bacteroidota bacterium]|jgi:hypothetical protein